MRLAIVGAGPAGLYLASLWKRRHPNDDVQLFEQNPAGATFGFGVVFSDRALEFLRDDDPETVEFITPHMETWRDVTLVCGRETIPIDGVGFSAVGRLTLIELLRARAEQAGACLRFSHTLHSMAELEGFDVIVGADGVNSFVRRAFETDFGTTTSYLDNKFVWYGTTKRFETLTQTFIQTEEGHFNAHHYRFEPSMSTFIVECDRPTWLRAGFDQMTADRSRERCEQLFAASLDGHPLVANRSIWRNFPCISNRRWSHRNMVLLGDALRTAHYSIGSGTRLALEDCLALVKALESDAPDLAAAFARYEAARRPAVEKLVGAANASAAWYERFAVHMQQPLTEFAFGYITRSGRIDAGRLKKMSPRFMDWYDANRLLQAAGP